MDKLSEGDTQAGIALVTGHGDEQPFLERQDS